MHCVYSLQPIFHGDPRDYAWGADGLDNAITQVSFLLYLHHTDRVLMISFSFRIV